MIVRLVKMTFREGETSNFEAIFESSRDQILASPGCQDLVLLRDLDELNTFFTYSTWNSEEDLEAYRSSDLFRSTWRKTRALFDKKAEAWTFSELEV